MRRELPSGTVTFLFTDIEGSTRLLHEHGDRYADLLAEHRRLLREAFDRHGGVEVDTQGDAFFVAFARASDALAAAADGRSALGDGPMRVRMGLHTGEPVVTDEGYVGIDVHRAARIAAAGHGGQVLLSQSTRDLVAGDDLRDLGEHRLKDLSAPERLFQLGDGEFPRLKTLYGTNLPVPATPFLGRDEELAEVEARLTRDDVRLLTLTGAGGSGKTRLALQAAAADAGGYPNGVWWVPLAPVADAGDVFPAAARVFGGGASLAETIGDKRLLLLLDNFEHVVDAASEVPELLGACPRLDLLVTSRERLRVQGEHVYAVPVLARAEARQLFVTRASATSRDFHPDEHVDELCARLDDLPLALELAAARTSLLTTEELLARLGNRLDVLRGGRDAEVRQRTLRATIEWSYDLLEPEEQRLLAALSVFRGGWSLEGAEHVCGAADELLESLADKSLVRRWEASRFGMLETIREFAAERLEPAERELIFPRLVDHLLALAKRAGDERPELVAPERANVDSALAWALAVGETALGLRLLVSLELYWSIQDPLAARRWLDEFFERAGDDVDPVLRAHALRLRGATFDMAGRSDLAYAEYRRAEVLFREAGEDAEVARLLNRLATSALQSGDMDGAAALASEALAVDRELRNRRDEAMALSVLGRVALMRGQRQEGTRLIWDSAAIAEEIGFLWWRGPILGDLADWLVDAGELDEAERALRLSAEAVATVGDRVNTSFVLVIAARLAAARGDARRAGVMWGAVEAGEESDPTPAFARQRDAFEQALRPVGGPEFEDGREQGRTLSLQEALEAVRTSID